MLKTALLAAACTIACLSGTAHAGPEYDVKIEQAAKRIVARKVGDIRGAVFAPADLPAPDPEPLEVAAAGSDAGLNPVRIAVPGPLAFPALPYRSGRPETVRKVRRITSFIYY